MEGPTMAMASSEERRDEPTKELVYKTKTIQFLGRTTPIILQNDNGPCPLLAICNVLLLRNHLSLNPDVTEVSQERLLSLVAERLIDSNSNVDNKDAGYVENQQQNIADAIDLLPRLTTGIDVNTKFRRIDDFEFTSECAIFDLLDIPLYHGWIVDPQDAETANAIGSKSYNALMGDLVELETRYMKEKQEKNSEGDAIDFVAATTATLGVPSPALSRGISFDEATQAASNHHDEVIREGDMKQEAEPLTSVKLSEPELVVPVNSSPIVDMSDQKHPCNSNEAEESKVFERSKEHSDIASQKNDDQGDMEHEAELLKAIKLSENDLGVAANNSPVVDSSDEQISADASEDLERKNSESVDIVEKLVACSKIESQKNDEQEPVPFQDSSNQVISSETDFRGSDCLNLKTNEHNLVDEPVRGDNVEEKSDKVGEHEDKQRDCNKVGVSDSSTQVDASTISRQCVAEPETCSSSAPGGEPIYEGEECVLESDMNMCKDGEPMYEGEMVLAEQSCKGTKDYDGSCKDQLSPRQGKLIGKFFKNNASQLTIYGLFCLQDGLKQRELCVFFRNNHFNTMFKFDGELYILATDQGYISQPGLVWEKLNEVNGNSVFMTSNFKEFQVEDEINTNTWDEQNAMASTADYLASVDNSAHLDSSFNSDLQLAIALQQKEFEEQQQPQRNTQPSTVGSSRLITGPQVPRSSGKSSSSSVSPRQEAKSSSSKDKSCTVM